MKLPSYRKSQKPEPKRTGWPFEPDRAGGAASPVAGEIDQAIEQFEGQNLRKEGARKLGRALFITAVLIAIVAWFAIASYQEDEEQAACVRGGGRVEAVHNARRIGFGQPWICLEGR